ncbi:MAG: DUF817 domain-containing protein [Planctomycetaceae bacterium]|nr:DUF817 domain-containing protein [Planctomycetaceae bacterium]
MEGMRVVLKEFWLFGIKQASASIFGGYLLALILLTKFWDPFDEQFYRYDFLFVAAVAFQVALLVFRLESLREAAVILIFHIVATAMELFKTSDAIGSWHYPGDAVIRLGNVPLFAGFMYSAVGSYIARVWRIFDFRFTHYPPVWTTVILVLLIYMNFFTHHFWIDLRYPLLLGTLAVFGRTRIHFKMDQVHRWMPLVLGCFLVATFIWFAENLATYSHIWLYPGQEQGWHMVPISKLIAWYLLMMLSFVLVSLVRLPIPAMEESPRGTIGIGPRR